MLRMAVGQSDDVDGVEAVRAAIEQCREQLDGETPRAGLLFATFDSFDPALVREVRSAFPGIRLIGSSSSAEMSSVVGYREDSVTLAVFASDTVGFTTAASTWEPGEVEAAGRAAVEAAIARDAIRHRGCASWWPTPWRASWPWRRSGGRCPRAPCSWVGPRVA